MGRLSNGGHLKPVTLKPVSRIFSIFHVFMSAFSVFSASSASGISSNPCFLGEWDLPHFPHLPRIGFEALILKIRLTGFIMTGLGDRDPRVELNPSQRQTGRNGEFAVQPSRKLLICHGDDLNVSKGWVSFLSTTSLLCPGQTPAHKFDVICFFFFPPRHNVL